MAGRRHTQGDRRAASPRSRPAGHHRPCEPGPAARGPEALATSPRSTSASTAARPSASISTTRRARRRADGDVPERKFHRLEISHRRHQRGRHHRYPSCNNVGFAEIRMRDDAPGATDVHADEIVRMPTDLVTAAGHARRRPPARFRDEPVAHVVIPPRYSQDEAALVRASGARARVPSAARARSGSTTAAPDDVLDVAARASATRHAGGITVHVVGAPARRHHRARLVGVRRRSRHRVEHRLRLNRRVSGSTWCTPAAR